ncbi:MAG: hypothetical protein C0407_04035 [Desulfobacca sp.]|nr:hypothetical protein [Desulfobacca sp.]
MFFKRKRFSCQVFLAFSLACGQERGPGPSPWLRLRFRVPDDFAFKGTNLGYIRVKCRYLTRWG